jgi:hypothetical protein
MWNIDEQLIEFFDDVAKNKIEVYNEFSLQHELGYFLRSKCEQGTLIQFERPAHWFGIQSKLTKKEIDIAVVLRDKSHKIAIELKYPRNGQYPEQMFKACQDIRFLEELCANEFDSGYFVMLVDHCPFYQGGFKNPIYGHFRDGAPICNVIWKPTGTIKECITMTGSHVISWKDISEKRKYACVKIQNKSDTAN